ncbi:MAG: preprotein translocase subunit SecA [bacterium]|nr:preprotein translocase subunit SecA [bacterium]
MGILSKLFGDPNEKVVGAMLPMVARVNALEEHYAGLSNEELKNQTPLLRERLANGETLDAIMPDAFAVCREAAKRTIKQRHYDVQIVGATVLHHGQIAEMHTGEGKTLTATLAVYLNALSGKGAHVVTVNDYLAMRDAVWMGQVYHSLGLTVGCIQSQATFIYDPGFKVDQMSVNEREEAETEQDTLGAFKVEHEFMRPGSRREAYEADITYGTNNEFGFDYLRDNLAMSVEHKVQRELNYAIVDEVDSILIDEARTPLIISGPAEESSEEYYRFAKLVSQLTEKDDYVVDEKMRASTLTEAGLKKMEEWLGLGNVYTAQNIKVVHHIEQALKAFALFKRDKDYVVKDDEVVIVDEFTGRMLAGRRYSEGLHQAIEAKEGVKIQRESQTYATITFQNLFRMYSKLAGMTGTAATEAEEFSKIYKLEVVTIPTNKPTVRNDLTDRIYKNARGKYKAIAQEIKERHEKGQPILVGTVSIEKNELLSALLDDEGIPHKVLNAKNHEQEAEIIAQAGAKGAVTVATNMAGRGVDIILGGNPPNKEDQQEVRELGGLLVIGSERHESRRIDNQLRGRSGRQGDPGASQFYVSMDDDLMRIFGSERMQGMMDRLGVPEDQHIENKMITRSIEEAQRKVEGHNFDTRKHVVEYDDVLNKHRDAIYRRRNEVLNAYDHDAKEIVDETDFVSSTPYLKTLILKMIEDEIEHLVMFHTQSDDENVWEIEPIYEAVGTIFHIAPDARIQIESIQHTAGDKLADAHARTKIIQYLYDLAVASYGAFENSVIIQMQSFNVSGIDAWRAIRQVERDLCLRAVDSLWMEHLEAMDHMRAGIGLRGYGQKDPLVEYKREAYRLFSEMIALVNKQVVYSIYKIGFAPQQTEKQEIALPKNAVYSAPVKEGDGTIATELSSPRTTSGAIATDKVGRNDMCPCGSGKKYKKCHGM